MSADVEPILKRLKQARKDADYSQQDVAEIIGYQDTASICQIETGRVPPTLDVLLKLCEVYAVSPLWVITGKAPQLSVRRCGLCDLLIYCL